MEVPRRAISVSFSGTGDEEQDEKILQPFTYILKSPGRGIPTKLAKALNYWLNVPADLLPVLLEVFELYHIAGILIDDIQDNCPLRRGIPAAQTVYGVARSISVAMCVIFTPLQMVLSTNQPDLIKLYTKMMLESWRGQTLEIYWRDNYTCPSEKEYVEMVKRKTSGLFTFGGQMMQLCSENKADFTKLTDIFGPYYQFRDDYFDLFLQELSEKKISCDDITEGKFTFPIIHAIKSRPNDLQVSSILQQRTTDAGLKNYFVTLLEKFGSLSYTRHTLDELDAEIRAEIAKHGGNPILEDILDKLLTWRKGTGENPLEK